MNIFYCYREIWSSAVWPKRNCKKYIKKQTTAPSGFTYSTFILDSRLCTSFSFQRAGVSNKMASDYDQPISDQEKVCFYFSIKNINHINSFLKIWNLGCIYTFICNNWNYTRLTKPFRRDCVCKCRCFCHDKSALSKLGETFVNSNLYNLFNFSRMILI